MLRDKLGLIVIITVGLLIGVSGGPTHAIKPDDVVGLWLFDEGKGDVAGDSSGNGQNGEVLADVKWVKGKFDDALMFPGTVTNTSYVRVPNNPSLDLSEHSITAWIKVTPTVDDWQCIVCKWEPHQVRNYSLMTQNTEGPPGGLMVHITSGGPKQYVGIHGQTSLTDDEWHHIACAYDGSLLRGYVDGTMIGEKPAGQPDTNPGDLTIGARWGGIHPTTGIIDDVGLFRVALEEDEIKEIMTNGLQKVLDLTAVEPLHKLTTTWAGIKARD